MRDRLLPAVLVAVLTLLLVGEFVVAQEEVELPVTPDPSQCDVEPITAEELIEIAERATMLAATPQPDDADEDDEEAFALPDGEPADEETVREITQLMVTFVACINGGAGLATLNLVSEAQLAEIIGPGATPEDFASIPGATPEPEEGWGTLLDVREVTALGDGRVGALIDTHFPDEDNEVATGYFIFVEEDGRWKIDEVVENLGEQYPPEVTPAA